MRHQVSGRKLGRPTAARMSMFAGLATELLRYGQIRTTLPKAKDLRGIVEPLITKAKTGTLANRRLVARTIRDESIVQKLFDDIAPRFSKRPGGYTRVLKAGFRDGDNAAMAIIELTEDLSTPAPKKAEKAPAKAKTAKVAKPAAKAKKE